jgi:hypothetical protein
MIYILRSKIKMYRRLPLPNFKHTGKSQAVNATGNGNQNPVAIGKHREIMHRLANFSI